MLSEFTRAGMFTAVNCVLVFLVAQRVPFDPDPQRREYGKWLTFILLWGLLWFLVKLYFLIFSVVWVRWTFPRTQFYGLLNLSWKILIPVSLATLVLSSAMIKHVR